MKLRLTVAILLVALLPSIALAAVGVATGAIPFQSEVEYLANKNIAWKLKISEHTVKFHIASIFTKL